MEEHDYTVIETAEILQSDPSTSTYDACSHLMTSGYVVGNAEVEEIPKIWTSSKGQTEHDRAATYAFLELRKQYDVQFSDKKHSKISLWNKIATEMNNAGYYVGRGTDGREKCRLKFNALQNAYMKYKDKCKQTGEGKIPKPLFYDEIDEILGEKHKVEPPLIIESALKSTNNIPNILSTSESSTSIHKNHSHDVPGTSGVNNSASVQTDRFSKISSSVRPSKHEMLNKLCNLFEQSYNFKKTAYEDTIAMIREENERRHQEVMGMLQILQKRGGKKRKKPDSSDSD